MKKPSVQWRQAKETTLGATFRVVRRWSTKTKVGRVLVRKPGMAWFLTHPVTAVCTAICATMFAVINPIGFITFLLGIVAVYAIVLKEPEIAVGAFLLAIAVPMLVLLVGAISFVSVGIVPLVFFLWTRWWMTSPPVTISVSEDTRAKLKKLERGG